MRVLLDHRVPKRLRRQLGGHQVSTAYEMGWASASNGRLLDLAEPDFDVLLTVGQNLRHQQNLRGGQVALIIVVAPNNRLETLLPLVPGMLSAVERIQPGNIIVVPEEGAD